MHFDAFGYYFPRLQTRSGGRNAERPPAREPIATRTFADARGRAEGAEGKVRGATGSAGTGGQGDHVEHSRTAVSSISL